MSLRVLLKSLFILVSTSANAGTWSSGGGNAVVCRNPQGAILSAEVLDFYEARLMRSQFQINLGPTTASFFEKVETAFSRLQVLNPHRANQYRQDAAKLLNTATFVSGVQLIEIPDSHHLFIPTGCKIEQAAVQQIPQFPGDFEYIFNEDIWNAMDSTSQAGLIVHEVVYRDGRANGATDSTVARYLNSLMAVNELRSVGGIENWLKLLAALKLKSGDVFGVDVILSSVKFSSANVPKEALLAQTQDVLMPNGMTRETDGKIKWHPNGKVAELTPDTKKIKWSVLGQNFDFTKVSFHESGAFASGLVHGYPKLTYKGQEFVIAGLALFEDGVVQSFDLTDDFFVYISRDNQTLNCTIEAVFYPSGLLKECKVRNRPVESISEIQLPNKYDFSFVGAATVKLDIRGRIVEISSSATAGKVGGKYYLGSHNGWIELDYLVFKDSYLSYGKLRWGVTLSYEDGRKYSYQSGSRIFFDKNGWVVDEK